MRSPYNCFSHLTVISSHVYYQQVKVCGVLIDLGLDLHAEVQAYVVIGRRSMLEAKHIRRYQEISTDKTGVMSYDRLLDTTKSGRNFLAAGNT